MAVVDVADFEACAVRLRPPGPRADRRRLVGQLSQRIVLVHELGQLGGSEELLDGGVHRTDVDQGLRGDGLRILGGHTLANHALHTAQAGAQLVLDQLADLTDTTIAEVVDIVDIHAQVDVLAVALARELGIARMQGDQVLDGGDDVLAGQAAVVDVLFQTKLAVDLVTADAGQIVTLGVEVEGVQQVLAGFRGRGCRPDGSCGTGRSGASSCVSMVSFSSASSTSE